MSQIIEDENRPLTISDLAALLNDPVVGRCVYWENVGLQIGVDKSDTEAIKRNEHYQVEDCRREMLTKFLRNNREGLTLNELRQVVKRVDNYYETRQEAENAEFAVDQLVKLLNIWEERNETIATELEQLLVDLEQEKSQISNKSKIWHRHDDEWQQGELGNKKAKIQTALHQGNLKRSPIVKELFRNKDVSLSQLSDQVVECILRRDLTEIELSKLNTMEPDLYRQMKRHLKRTERLHSEILTYNKMLEERLLAYGRIEQGLKTIGIKKEKIEELNKQLEKLKRSVKKCNKLLDESSDVTQMCKSDLDNWTIEITTFIKSLAENIKQMKETEPEYIQAMYVLFGIAGGAVAGGVSGAVFGTALLPGIGTAVGAGIGATIGTFSGLIWGSIKGDEERKKVERKVRNYRETISKAQAKHSTLQELLRD